ncbi:hypothetical protein B0H14DRAFT_2563102 [Mycena olivaceomarginata]|nr:hypothetical protein B0H14DRAFT_2563102 [Mycena olivaceomarginata]
MTSPSRGSGSPAAEQQLDSQQFSGRGRIEEARSSETPLNGSWRVEQTAGAVKTRSMASEDERRLAQIADSSNASSMLQASSMALLRVRSNHPLWSLEFDSNPSVKGCGSRDSDSVADLFMPVNCRGFDERNIGQVFLVPRVDGHDDRADLSMQEGGKEGARRWCGPDMGTDVARGRQVGKTGEGLKLTPDSGVGAVATQRKAASRSARAWARAYVHVVDIGAFGAALRPAREEGSKCSKRRGRGRERDREGRRDEDGWGRHGYRVHANTRAGVGRNMQSRWFPSGMYRAERAALSNGARRVDRRRAKRAGMERGAMVSRARAHRAEECRAQCGASSSAADLRGADASEWEGMSGREHEGEEDRRMEHGVRVKRERAGGEDGCGKREGGTRDKAQREGRSVKNKALWDAPRRREQARARGGTGSERESRDNGVISEGGWGGGGGGAGERRLAGPGRWEGRWHRHRAREVVRRRLGLEPGVEVGG